MSRHWAVRSADVPAFRDAAATQVEFPSRHWVDLSRQGAAFWGAPPGQTPEEYAPGVQALHASAVRRSALFHVSAEMVDLARVAAESLPEFTVFIEDLPAEYGFMVFDAPLYYTDRDGDVIPIRAFSWQVGTWMLGLPAVHVVEWGDTETFRRWALPDGAAPLAADRWVREEIALLGQLTFDLEFRVGLGVPINAATSGGDAVETLLPHGSFLKTIWLLMQQKNVAEETEARFDRASRRRARREGRELPAVRVIDLRRRASGRATPGGDDEGREYHHRWLVRGHWRQHWHPARKVHRPVWIAPHIKGPEGKPMLGGEKVYAVR